MGTELNSELAKAMKVDAQRGAFVSQVMPGSAAAKAGIKAGDVITSLNGKAISSFAALRAQVGTMPIGSKVELGPAARRQTGDRDRRTAAEQPDPG